MLSTDAWAFLDILRPVCAWATYRGALVCSPPEPGFVSVWTASVLRADDVSRILIELSLEDCRRQFYPERPSRLTSMYCFRDIESAERACATGMTRHCRPEFLAELSLAEATPQRDRFDLNWVNLAHKSQGTIDGTFDWTRRYWQGEPCAAREPIWETLVRGRLHVLGTDLRDRAYRILKRNFPDSLMLLEIARQACWVGSNLGSLHGSFAADGEDLVLRYAMDMRDANEESFLLRLRKLRRSGHPINWQDMKPHVERDSFGRTPDLLPFSFRIANALGSAQISLHQVLISLAASDAQLASFNRSRDH
jgi:hypothetical protein